MSAQKFIGGSDPFRNKLNGLVDEVNTSRTRPHGGSNGIGQTQSPFGIVSRLVIDAFQCRIPRVGGGAQPDQQMRVIGFGAGNFTLQCQAVNPTTGAPTGNVLTVRCYVYNEQQPAAWPNWQNVDLTQCLPPMVAHATNGSIVPVERRGDEYWCRFPFTFYGCSR